MELALDAVLETAKAELEASELVLFAADDAEGTEVAGKDAEGAGADTGPPASLTVELDETLGVAETALEGEVVEPADETEDVALPDVVVKLVGTLVEADGPKVTTGLEAGVLKETGADTVESTEREERTGVLASADDEGGTVGNTVEVEGSVKLAVVDPDSGPWEDKPDVTDVVGRAKLVATGSVDTVSGRPSEVNVN